MNLKYLALFINIILVFASCNKSSETIEEKNGFNDLYQPSEMSLLMEDMYKFYKDLKPLIIDNSSVGNLPSHFVELYTAKLTDGFIHDELMKNYSDLFIENARLLHNSEIEDKTKLYNSVINSCIACHNSEIGCKGPIPRIQKLLIQ